MKINRIVFNNFRNYKGKHTFVLNKQITILYGENGNGKSSFFDGIEWCLTGVISRFSEKRPPKEAIANKRILLGEECFVEIYFDDLCVRRAFSRNSNSFGNIDFCLLSKSNSRGIFEKIASGEENVDLELRKIFENKGVKYKDIKYKVGEIINKAYILSQDQVSDFVTRDKPNDRYHALASIMGFEKVLKLRKNLNNSRKILNDAFLETEKEKGVLQEKIEVLNTKIKPIDNGFLEKFLQVNESLPENKTDLKVKTDNLQSQLFTIDNEISIINKLILEKFDTEKDIEKEIISKQEQVYSSENILKQLFIEENRINTEISYKNKTIKKVTQNNKVNNEISESQNKIKLLLNQLKALEIESDASSYEQINTSLHENEKEKRKVEFARKYKYEYDFAKLFIRDYDDNLNKKQVILQKQNEHLYEISNKQAAITRKILNNDNNSSVNILIKSIEDISNYLNVNNPKGVCPVCLSNVGEDLNLIISKNLNQLIETVGKQKEMVTSQLKARETMELEISKQKNFIENLEFEMEGLLTKNKVSHETIRNIEDNQLFGNYFGMDNEVLSQKEKNLKEISKNFKNALEILNEIQGYKETVAFNSNVDKSILDEDIQSLIKNLNTLDENSTLIKKRITEEERIISKRKSLVFNLENKKREYEAYFKKYNESSLVRIIENLNKLQINLNESLSLYDDVSAIIDNQQYNKEIEDELKVFVEKLSYISNKSDKFFNKLKIMDGLLNNLDREYGEEATDFLNNSDSSIQTYYRYLNPNPSEFNNLHFEVTDNENLYIKIKHKDINGEIDSTYFTDANMVLSSGQLNVLALAIFIATNESQNCSYFDFIAIDDPIQNMDDINRFSISDILGNLDRQLIFSTHDQEFLNLFLKKNELRHEGITLFTLNADENIYKSMII